MREGMSGSLIYKLDPLAAASKSLCLNDVVLAIEDVPIADDSTIEFREEERVEFTYHVRTKHVGALPGCSAPSNAGAILGALDYKELCIMAKLCGRK